MRFTDIFIRRPVLAFVISALILLVGMRSLTTLPVRQFPLLTNTVVTVTTIYPGATAELMQGFITTPLQQAIATADGIDYITSTSVLGASTIHGLCPAEFRSRRRRHRDHVEGAAGPLPDAARRQRSEHHQEHRADDRDHVYRLREPLA